MNRSPLAGLLISIYMTVGFGWYIISDILDSPDQAVIEQRIREQASWLDSPEPLPYWSEKQILQWQCWQYEKRWKREEIRQKEWPK